MHTEPSAAATPAAMPTTSASEGDPAATVTTGSKRTEQIIEALKLTAIAPVRRAATPPTKFAEPQNTLAANARTMDTRHHCSRVRVGNKLRAIAPVSVPTQQDAGMPVVQVGDRSIHYTREGIPDGRLLVFLHAFPLDAGMWAPQLAALNDVADCVAIDFTGFGASDVPEDAGEYSTETWAAEVAAVVESLDRGPAIPVGLSLGGYVSLALIERRPDLVEALVLCDARSTADSPDIAARRTQQQQRCRDEGVAAVLADLVPSLVGNHAQRDAVLEEARQIAARANVNGVIGALDAMKRRPDRTQALAEFGKPLLLVVGVDDGIIPPAVVREMANTAPQASVVEIPDAGHVSNLDNPVAFNDAVRRFLATA